MSSQRIKPITAGGFRDYLPGLQIQRARIVDRIRSVYERFGFDPLETPAVERTGVLTGGDDALDKALYRAFPARGGRWPRREPDQSTCLRFDLTVPLARVVAANPELPRPFRRYQVGTVWRGEKPQLGRFREFLQFDADIVGSSSTTADAEMIEIMDTVVRELGFTRYTTRINDRRVLTGLAEKAGFDDDTDRVAQTIRTLDKIESIGPDAVVEELARPIDGDPKTRGAGLDAEAIVLVRRYLELDPTGGSERLLESLAALVGDTPSGSAGVSALTAIVRMLGAAGVDASRWRLDPTIARGLDYYTGPIWEMLLDDAREIGSVYSGGRYDGLVGRFIKGALVPCTGTSVGVDRLFAGMELLGMLESAGTVLEVLVLNVAPELANDYVALAGELRGAGLRAATYLGDDLSFQAQVSYAARLGVPVALILGPDEKAQGVVGLKHMHARTQEAIRREDIVAAVGAILRPGA